MKINGDIMASVWTYTAAIAALVAQRLNVNSPFIMITVGGCWLMAAAWTIRAGVEKCKLK